MIYITKNWKILHIGLKQVSYDKVFNWASKSQKKYEKVDKNEILQVLTILIWIYQELFKINSYLIQK